MRTQGTPESPADPVRFSNGDITSLCGGWGEASKTTAIIDIELGRHRYYVAGTGSTEVDVHVVNGNTGKYLRTDPDGSTVDNLDELPDC
jgi:hypothetical protein